MPVPENFTYREVPAARPDKASGLSDGDVEKILRVLREIQRGQHRDALDELRKQDTQVSLPQLLLSLASKRR
jgi:hypothetical protein